MLGGVRNKQADHNACFPVHRCGRNIEMDDTEIWKWMIFVLCSLMFCVVFCWYICRRITKQLQPETATAAMPPPQGGWRLAQPQGNIPQGHPNQQSSHPPRRYSPNQESIRRVSGYSPNPSQQAHPQQNLASPQAGHPYPHGYPQQQSHSPSSTSHPQSVADDLPPSYESAVGQLPYNPAFAATAAPSAPAAPSGTAAPSATAADDEECRKRLL